MGKARQERLSQGLEVVCATIVVLNVNYYVDCVGAYCSTLESILHKE